MDGGHVGGRVPARRPPSQASAQPDGVTGQVSDVAGFAEGQTG
jgi:hypothetical protein